MTGFFGRSKAAALRLLFMFLAGSRRRVDLRAKTGTNAPFSRKERTRINLVRTLLTKGHIGLLRISGGRWGSVFLGMPILLLTTIGRKSGKPRTLPLFYVQQGSLLVLVGSNAGAPGDPVWLLNGEAHPQVIVQVGGRKREMRLRRATAAEKSRYWPALTEQFPKWQRMEDRSRRDIPVVLLEPAVVGDAASSPS